MCLNVTDAKKQITGIWAPWVKKTFHPKIRKKCKNLTKFLCCQFNYICFV